MEMCTLWLPLEGQTFVKLWFLAKQSARCKLQSVNRRKNSLKCIGKILKYLRKPLGSRPKSFSRPRKFALCIRTMLLRKLTLRVIDRCLLWYFSFLFRWSLCPIHNLLFYFRRNLVNQILVTITYPDGGRFNVCLQREELQEIQECTNPKVKLLFYIFEMPMTGILGPRRMDACIRDWDPWRICNWQ